MDKKNPLVVISKGEDPYEAAKTALRKFPLPDLKGRKILIKPNAARLAFPGEGVTTHPLVVEATIDRLKEKGASDIVIGESCIFGVKAQEAFRMTGMKEISEKKKVKLVDLDQIDSMEMTIPQGKVIKKIKVSAILKEMDFIISVPVMKTHMHTRVTLSIKNMKGLLWRREKASLHQLRCDETTTRGYKTLDMAISDMASVLLPHLAIIDGTVGMEGMGPAYGRPKRMEIVLVGNNPLSTDAVATRLMGFDPMKVPHLKLSAKKGLGEIKLKQISIQPEDYLKWEAPFNPPPSKLSIPFPDIIVHNEGSCSACLSTLLVFLQDYHQELGGFQLKDRKVHIALGKHLKTCPEGTILIGNCTSKMKSKGVFIQGCPPVASQIWDTFLKRKKPSEKFFLT
jgi:uncharacterized protein (DUF362 family)